MAKIGGMERTIISLTVNGEDYGYTKDITKVDLPTKDRSYWIFESKDGKISYITGHVRLDISPASEGNKEKRYYKKIKSDEIYS